MQPEQGIVEASLSTVPNSLDRTPKNLVTGFIPLPPVSENPPYEIPSNQVVLTPHRRWNKNEVHWINIEDCVPKVRHSVPTSIADQASWCAFNLPVGTVVTLAEHYQVMPDEGFASLKDLGRCVELVGTGSPQTIDLGKYGIEDSIDVFFWRNVDLDFGAIELFEHRNYAGIRTILFLSEWASAGPHSIENWYVHDRVTSARWLTLDDRTTAILFDGSQGDGRRFGNIKGWGYTKEIVDFSDLRFDNKMGSWRWDHVRPVKEIIKPFEILVDSDDATKVTTSVSGTNNSDEVQELTLKFDKQEAQQMSCEITDTHAFGLSVTYGMSTTAGNDVTGKVQTSWQVGVSVNYEQSQSRSTSFSTTIALGFENKINAPPRTSYNAFLQAEIGRAIQPETPPMAIRWYDVRVAGSVADGVLWRREENMNIRFQGSLATTITTSMSTKPFEELDLPSKTIEN